jgi:hypothetical protein
MALGDGSSQDLDRVPAAGFEKPPLNSGFLAGCDPIVTSKVVAGLNFLQFLMNKAAVAECALSQCAY